MTPTKNAQMQMGNNHGVSPSPSRQTDRDRPLPPPPAGEEPRRPEQKNYTQLGTSPSSITALSNNVLIN
jgi:hypothetical protein